MFNSLTLADLQAAVTTLDGTFKLGDVAVVNDATYGPIKAVFCKVITVQAAALYTGCQAPMYKITGSTVLWNVSEDYNGSSCNGISCAVGFALATTWAAAGYIWVQVAGYNPMPIETGGDVAANAVGRILIGTTTPGLCSSAPSALDMTTSTTGYVNGYRLGLITTTEATTGVLAAGSVMVNSVWSCLERTL